MKNFSLANCSVEYRPIDWIKPGADNPRIHPPKQKAMLEAAIFRSRHINPLLVKPDGELIAGALRLEVASQMGLTEVPVITIAHLTDAECLALRLAANKIADKAEWSIELLAKNLELISTLDMTIAPIELGLETGEYDQIRLGTNALMPVEAVPLPDHSAPAVTQLGDVIHVGAHTIVCGDSRNSDVYAQALAGCSAAAVISDQPWNLAASFISGKGKTRFDDFVMASGEMSKEAFEGFTEEVLTRQAEHCAPGALVAQFIDWRSVEIMIRIGRKTIGELVNICVWVKQNGRFGSPWRSRHELVCIFRRAGDKSRDNVQLGRFGRNRTNVWEYDAPTIFGSQRHKLQLHPTCKNEAMIADFVLDCTNRGDVVLDAFLGSGTTLLAAQHTDRVGVGIEIDPHYVDLAVQRLAELTGEPAYLADGTTFDELRARRLEAEA
jgi:DNA modification methylase